MPAVSVVIRSHNSRRHIDRALASLIAQDFADWEAWVVDDASTDGTAGWLVLAYGDEPRLSVLAQPVHRGAAAAANRGLQAATGEYVAFLDADDAWRPPLLSALITALRTNPEPVAACCDTVQAWDEFGFSRLPPPGPPPGEAAAMLTGNPIPCLSAVLFRTDAIRRLGGMDETLTIAHDRDLLLRCAFAARRPILHLPAPLAERHLHSGNLINDTSLWQQEGRVALNRAFAGPARPLAALQPNAEANRARWTAGYEAQRRALVPAPQPPISVIVPTLAGGACPADALASVARQTYAGPVECIVVDTGDPVDSETRLASCLGQARIVHAASCARMQAFQLGAAAATSDLVAFLDPRDCWLDDYLASVVPAFALSPAPALVTSDCFLRPDSGRLLRRRNDPFAVHGDLVLRLFEGGLDPQLSGSVCRRDDVPAAGGPTEADGAFGFWLRLFSWADAEGTPAQSRRPPVFLDRPLVILGARPPGTDAEQRRLRAASVERFLAGPEGADYLPVAEAIRAMVAAEPEAAA